MDIQRIAAFSQGEQGGNPAGVVLLDQPAQTSDMARVAADVGYSETAFAVREDDSGKNWRQNPRSPSAAMPPLPLVRPWGSISAKAALIWH